MRTTVRGTVLALSLVALAACGGETASSPTDRTPTDSPATDSATDSGATDSATDSAATTGDAAVEIDDFAYDPETITVAAGTEVTWTNVDPALHSVTAGTPDAPEPESFDLDPLDEAGQTASHTFEEPGTYDYFCRYHDFMLGTVEVTD